ncbi:pumilio homolog 3 isoform X4 [Chelonia mydas]|uniref:pumilio homolog 3 isoform X4 n=1 Tax=Chelonia mydas TaxID=8469 RepID=UPI001CA94665|nr:pumilio homolog 3 isoform X4 [Chelonia mydas]
MEAKGKKRFMGKNGKAPQRKHKFKKDNDSGPPKKFYTKRGEEGKPKFRSKKSEKGNKKLGKTSVKQFKSKQQPEKFSRKRKLPEDNEGGSVPKKPKWNDLKRKKKELKQSRQLNDKTNYDVIIKSKQIWESVRRKNCDKKKREKLINELHKLLQGKIKTMAFAHDSTRVIQCFIRYGNDKQRQETFEELKDSLLELSKSKYSRNIVKKFLMYGTKPQVAEIIKSFKGEVKKMLRHSEASAVVEYAYNDKAILEQRIMLAEELYGNTFQVYKSPVHPTLDKVLEAHPEKQEAIMDEMKQILTPVAQKEAVIKHSLVHKVFLDFFIHALPKQRSEMIEAIREAVIYLAHTHDGARVAMHALWHGTPKDRKIIMKTMKTYVEKIATGEFSHLVLLAAFDCIDDTKLMKQLIISMYNWLIITPDDSWCWLSLGAVMMCSLPPFVCWDSNFFGEKSVSYYMFVQHLPRWGPDFRKSEHYGDKWFFAQYCKQQIWKEGPVVLAKSKGSCTFLTRDCQNSATGRWKCLQ